MLIVVLTKDRPDRLLRSLPSYAGARHPIVLLDDSCDLSLRSDNALLAKRFGVQYHGPSEQAKVIRNMEGAELEQIVGGLGKLRWNLANNRNYALLLARRSHATSVLMCDDDVCIGSSDDLELVSAALKEHAIVGCEVNGMPDHSIVGHLYKAGGELIQPQCASGMFMAMRLDAVTQCYPNTYNEDWIWLTLQAQGNALQLVRITQLEYDPFTDLDHRLPFQEQGELFFEGVYQAVSEANLAQLSHASFWGKVLTQRMEKIAHLQTLELRLGQSDLMKEVHTRAMHYLSGLNVTILTGLWTDYQHRLRTWESIWTSKQTMI